MKCKLVIPVMLLIVIAIVPTQAAQAQNFNFNDGTMQGWTMEGAYDENGNGPYPHNFIPGWTDQVNYPTPDPGSNLGVLQLYADVGHGISGSTGSWWIIELHSPDLSTDASWQGSRGYSVRLAEHMGIRSDVYANQWVTIHDNNLNTDQTFYRGGPVLLTHSSTYDRDATWNSIEFDWSAIGDISADFVIKDIYVTIQGLMTGAFDGPVAIDEVVSLGSSTISRIKVDVPNGGESWDVGSTRYIRWHTQNYDSDVSIILTGTGVRQVITSRTANDGTYEWVVPGGFTLPLADARIRIEDADDGDPYDISDADFSIVAPAASITVDVPNGGENWDVGSERFIRWHSQGFTETVKIEYSVDNGTTYTLVDAAAPNSGTYAWTIPDTPTTTALVRISDTATGDYADESDAPFTISAAPASLTVFSPNGGESWQAGTTHDILWTSTNFAGPVHIEYSLDGGAFYTDIIASTSNSGTYAWLVPDTPTNAAVVRISDAADGEPSDRSDAVFTIVAATQPSITVLSPNGGESWQAGTTHDILWTSTDFAGPVHIEYSLDGGAFYTDIIASTTNSGSYGWLVPDTPTNSAVVRISDAADGEPSDRSDAVFTIVASTRPTITVVSPNGGESWGVGTTQSIRWTSTNFTDPVRIEYSTDGGATSTTIIASTPNAGSYAWLVPDTPTTQGTVIIYDPTDEDPFDVSDATFSIVATTRPTITVVSPDGGESWQVGTAQSIRWTTANFDAPVHIEYSTDGGTTYRDVVASTPNSGSYAWLVPDTPTSEALMRISDAADGDPFDTSGAVFTISAATPPTITVVSPNGGESWQAGTAQSILWTTADFNSPVHIEVSTDGGASYVDIVGSTGNSGSYAWLVPNTPTTQGVVRISDAADGDPTDRSDAVFTIVAGTRPTITVVSPNGGESWPAGTAKTIRWTTVDFDAPVHIEYSTDGGTTFADIVGSVPNTGSYAWLVPDTPTAEALLRISDAADDDPSDRSDAVFTILAAAHPSITVTSPNGGERWAIGTSQTIHWTSQDFVGPVRLEYSTNGGTTYAIIAATIPNSGTFSWFVPGPPSSHCRIRVSDAADGDPWDVSDDDYSVVSGTGISDELPIPTEFAIYGNYPNPFRVSTTIRYAVPVQSELELSIYDLVGRRVRVLVTGDRAPGEYEATFRTGDLPPGFYFCRLRAGNETRVRTLLAVN